MDYSGLFQTPNDIRMDRLGLLERQAMQQRQMGGSMSGLLGQVAAGTGGMMAEGLAGAMGLKTEQEANASKVADVMKTVDTTDPESMRAGAKILAEQGLTEAATMLADKAAVTETQVNENTLKGLQIDKIKADKKAAQQARELAALQKQKAIESFTKMGRQDMVDALNMGMPIQDVIKMNKKEGVNVDGVLVDKNTGQVMYEPEFNKNGLGKFSIIGGDKAAEYGFAPGSVLSRNNKTGEITVKQQPKGELKIPEGYKPVYDENGEVERLEIIPGSKQEAVWKEEQKKIKESREMMRGAARATAKEFEQLSSDVDDALSIIAANPTISTGWAGNKSKDIAGTPAYNLNAIVQQAKSNKALKAMQEAKKNGATFGSMSNAEWEVLEKKGENLDIGQGTEQLVSQLKGYESGLMSAMWNLVNDATPEQLEEYGLSEYEWLRDKPEPSEENYDAAKPLFSHYSQKAVDASLGTPDNNPWAIPGEKKEAPVEAPESSGGVKTIKWSDL